jgi:hypothetical protein
METLAKQLFGAYYEYKRLKEGVLWDFIENTFGAGAVDNHSFDPYDNSLELYNVTVGWAIHLLYVVEQFFNPEDPDEIREPWDMLE